MSDEQKVNTRPIASRSVPSLNTQILASRQRLNRPGASFECAKIDAVQVQNAWFVPAGATL